MSAVRAHPRRRVLSGKQIVQRNASQPRHPECHGRAHAVFSPDQLLKAALLDMQSLTHELVRSETDPQKADRVQHVALLFLG